jgi:hypothetical protein
MSVVACPKCSEKVSLPEKTPPAAKVRCPLCSEQYLLSEALASLPPRLEVVELPDDYIPESDVDISAAAFLRTPDRPAPVDDGGEFKLQDVGGVATEERTEPDYDEWGPTKSTVPVHEFTEPLTEEPATLAPTTTTRRPKRKTINPLVHVAGIVLGGVVAIPTALLILLWMPGSLQRDPFEIGPWLGKNAPYLVPANFRNVNAPQDSDALAKPDEKPTATVANKGSKKNGSQPSSGMTMGGDKFEDALKNKGVQFGPGDSGKSNTPKAGNVDVSAIDEPKIDLPKEAPVDNTKTDEPKTEDPKTEVSKTDEPKTDEPKVDPPAVDEPKSPTETTEPPAPETVDAPPADPPATATDASTDTPDESVTLESPAPNPLTELRAATLAAESQFNAAANAQERKALAIAFYKSAAALAEKLPEGTEAEPALNSIAADAMKLQFVGVYAGTWLGNGSRGTSGIVLSGTVKECRQAGERYEITLVLPSREKHEVVVLAPAELAAGTRVFIAGKVVDNAKELVAGYQGEAVQAIDARLVKRVE